MLRVRQATKQDHSALREIYLKSRAQYFTWMDSSKLAPEDFDRDTEGELVLVATNGARIIGFVAVWIPDHFIHHLYVHPDYTGQQVGTKLLQTCYETFDASPPLTLKCIKENAKALRFYRSQGWHIKGDGVSSNGAYYLMEYGGIHRT
ncbi:GNAT family N-acetyltransferase [Cohnella herbarum]|uniref:GNAT family N-acetyltransferase n=1 Tax=Cohnella herbarum TaxID=2728023 RepID=A0A7Z2VPF0_9BACL|nr:GNAT family N-acetyltransferase [Cohnella herbarum]QJD86565.1 GNAT family N-acetyltransferase [Cohnella herbarum]